MTILYDVFITAPEMEEELTIEEKVTFTAIKDFYAQRLNALKDDIDKEELANPESNSCVIIHLLPPENQWQLPEDKRDQNIRTSMNGYSPELSKKMTDCFSKEDFDYLNNVLLVKLQSLGN